jgi:uncharacterized membrane protein
MTRVLLAGESWISTATHIKGFDEFTSTTFHTGADAFIAAAAAQDVHVEQMYAHDVPQKFPRTVERLAEYDAVILSDIGANSFVLPPEVWLEGKRTDNPLVALAEWTRSGGGLMMAGGYLSFQGFQARANFARTPVADVLPVTMLDGDDRAERPEGVAPALVDPDHPIAASWRPGAPELLGYNIVEARPDARVVARVGDDVLLATRQVELGRSLVWTTDIGPHWCPQPFVDWSGFSPLVGSMLRWLAGEED